MVENPTLPAWNAKKAALVIESLGRLRDRRAIQTIADRLGDPVLHDQAASALMVIGPQAENAVLDHLFDNDAGARLQACRLLQSYGVKPEILAGEALARLQ